MILNIIFNSRIYTYIFSLSQRSRTFFRRESRGEIDERKRAATLPFARLPPSALELTAAALHTSEAVELPKRPPWTATETKAALDAREMAAFERWLEGVYARHSVERMNYFEHNLGMVQFFLDILILSHRASVFAYMSLLR
jgi:hypothetical protein